MIGSVTEELIQQSEDPKINPFLGTRVPGNAILSFQNLKEKCDADFLAGYLKSKDQAKDALRELLFERFPDKFPIDGSGPEKAD